MERDEDRCEKALSATRVLGLKDKAVKRVLLDLLEVYDWNWELVEAEDYRALIDAYFELEETQEDPNGSKGPGKKMQLGGQADHDSSESTKSRNKLALEKAKKPAREFSKLKLSQMDKGMESSSQFHDMQFNRKLKDPVSTRFPLISTLKKAVQDRVSGSAASKMPLDSSHRSIGSTSSLYGNGIVGKSSLGKHDDASICSGNTSRRSPLNIASSALGEVNIALKCTPDLNNSNFQCPETDIVFLHLEEQLKNEKMVSPRFSLKKLLKALCDTYLELGKSTSGPIIKSSSSSELIIVGETPSRPPKKRAYRISNSEMELHKKGKNSSAIAATSDPAKSLFRNIADITGGREKVKISLVDEFGKEELPEFHYMAHNTVHQNAYIHVSLSRISDEDCCTTCLGDCLSSQIPCSCARETGGEFAYNKQGLLKEEFLDACMARRSGRNDEHLVYCQICPLERYKNENFPEPCQGHVIRTFIKECWTKCSCDMDCRNRTVQRGITRELQVFSTPDGKGWGLRPLKDLPKGTFVCEYVGEILTNTELYDRNMQGSGKGRHTYPVTLDADWGSEKVLRDEEALCLDATFVGNVARFINHRCFDSNLTDIPVEVETPDRHYYHLALFTSRFVNAFEELTWDYGIDFNDLNHPVKAFQCCCGSEYCRDMKRKG